MADSHVDPEGHVNLNKNYITKKVLVLMLENMVGVLAAASWRSGSSGDSGCPQGVAAADT